MRVLKLVALALAAACTSGDTAVTDPTDDGTPNTPAPPPPPPSGAAATVTITVNAASIVNADGPRLLGVSFDGRSSMTLTSGSTPVGYHEPATGQLRSGVAALWDAMPITTIRYPGNAVNQGISWRHTIGPLAARPLVTVTGAPPQRISFGFDEFMAMTAARGVASRDVQLMLNIYATAAEPDPVGSAADFVEYVNAPNNGSNPRGGTDWAAVRAANGHPQPYGVAIWNIGNEPWAPQEFNFQPAPYLAVAVPIIDAMRAVDPTIRITLPSTGGPNSAWNAALFASAPLAGKVHGLSPHAFYSEQGSGPTFGQMDSTLRALSTAAQGRGWKLILGDHAHDISGGSPSQADRELAMEWQGTIATAHYLAMLSQIPNVERANFWIYGATASTWAPIRRNSDGSFTELAVAQLYRVLRPDFLDQVLATTVASVGSAASPNVQATTFRAASGARGTVLVVNWDRALTHQLAAPTIAGLRVGEAQLFTATGLNAERFTAATVVPDSAGRYALPPTSVLVVRYQ